MDSIRYIRRTVMAVVLLAACMADRPARGAWYVPMADAVAGGVDHIQVIMRGDDLFASPVLFAFCGPDAQGAPSPQAEQWRQTFLARNPDYAAAEGPADGYEFLAFSVQVAGQNLVDRPQFHYQAWRDNVLVSSWDVTCVGPDDWDWTVADGTLLMGDANLDGIVDLQDFSILKDNFGGFGGWRQANFNGDYIVDLQDFGVLKAHFGEGTPCVAVPEPATLAAIALGALVARPRRRTGR